MTTKMKYPCMLGKKICERIYGRSMAPGTWRNWRTWAGCPRVRNFTFDQMMMLAAIATLRRQYPTNEIDILRINQCAATVEPKVRETLRAIEKEGCITGSQAIPILAGTLGVSRATIYRKLSPQGFSARKIYHLEELESMLAA